MSKKILLIAGVVLAAGSVAAISAPSFRGGHMRHGAAFGERGGGAFAHSRARLSDWIKEADANKDGVITLDEFLALRQPTLARLDRNKDGVIDAAEFEAAAKETADYWIKRFLKRHDANRDGKVSKEEFAYAARERFRVRDINDDGRIGIEDAGPGVRERFKRRTEGDRSSKDGKEGRRGPLTLERVLGRVERRFASLDRNGDGFIDAKDLEARAAERVAYRSQRFFRRFDADRDGKVTADEFHRFAKERFARLDLDDDGRITEADLPPRMRGRGLLK
jgi:Ca2+-binding EF-hand superfamily protein